MNTVQPLRAELVFGLLGNIDKALEQCVSDLASRPRVLKSRKVTVEIEIVPDGTAKQHEGSMPEIRSSVKVSLPSEKAGCAGVVRRGVLLVNPWEPEAPDQLQLDNTLPFSKEKG